MPVKIPLSEPKISWETIDELWRTQLTKPLMQQVLDFEDAIAKEMQVNAVLGTSSGTSAIHLALKVLNVTPGDVVLCPTFSFVATANPILYEGAIPLFIDSESQTWNLDPMLLEEAISYAQTHHRRPKALIVAHIYGTPAQMNTIMEICDHHDIAVIEDAAESFGAKIDGKHVGTYGHLGVLSFNNNKTFSTLGGGALVSDDPELIDRARYLARQAKKQVEGEHVHQELGYNYAMSPLNACLGYAQLSHLNYLISQRRALHDYLEQTLENCHQFRLNPEPTTYYATRWLSTLLFNSNTNMQCAFRNLLAQGFEVRRLWRPLHLQPLYQKQHFIGSSVAQNLYNNGLCLPSGWQAQQPQIRAKMARTIQESFPEKV